ncbi:unnamed protein product [Adineta steineri]|uniref:Kinesin motor domain-containing protein n=1 Tax=Adineta steineri TaxID=433720 RepID=A0A813WUP2_9BILA|nr:unnamed protein product [Adineta steineri]CAF1242400.1 unnamed protein product [Adineta steineri]
MQESIHIHPSLSTLRNVIDTLSRQQDHILYRDSSLIYLLKNSLDGDAKTYMFATISPLSTVIDETINTLRYAGLATKITNVPQIKTPHLRHEIDELREENARLKQELFLFYSGPSISPDEQIDDDEKLNIIDEKILVQIENQCHRPQNDKDYLNNHSKIHKSDDTMLHQRLGTILSYVTSNYLIVVTLNMFVNNQE